MKKWLEIYRAEIAELETTSDEEAIRKEVAEFEAELRKDYATRKATAIAHKQSVVASLEELIERQAKIDEEIEKAKQEAFVTEQEESVALGKEPSVEVVEPIEGGDLEPLEMSTSSTVDIDPFGNL